MSQQSTKTNGLENYEDATKNNIVHARAPSNSLSLQDSSGCEHVKFWSLQKARGKPLSFRGDITLYQDHYFIHYGDDLPCALVVARQKELQENQNVMYNLVKTTKDDVNLIESNLKLANVLPKNRIYRMESSEEFNLFIEELLKRPLVLQCTVDGGPGMGCMKWFPNMDCRVVRFSENYIVLLNQNHPKILGRLQMGLEVAQLAMKRSQAFILTFTFNNVIERLYSAILREFSETIGPQDIVNCHDGEIIIRYAPDSKGLHLKDALRVKEMTFAFEDLSSLDMKVDSLKCAHARQRRSLPLEQGELVSVLKGWKFGDLDTTKDLMNIYAEITGDAELNDVRQREQNHRPSKHPPSYQDATLLPVMGSKPQKPSVDYGYSDIKNYERTTPYNPRSDREDTSMTSQSRRVIKPPDNFESDGYPSEANTEYVNVGFYEDHHDRRQQIHRFAAENLRSDYDNHRGQPMPQGKRSQHQEYNVAVVGRRFREQKQQPQEEEEMTEERTESFI